MASPAAHIVIEWLLGQFDELNDRTTDRIFADISGYIPFSDDESLRADVRQHVGRHIEEALNGYVDDREVHGESLGFIRLWATRRIGRISVGDFMMAFHTAHLTLLEALRPLARESEDIADAALGLCVYLAHYFGIAATQASEIFDEAQQMMAETGERLRRDLLEELLAGGYPSGPRLVVAVEAGLLPAARLVVISARQTATAPDEDATRVAASALLRATRAPLLPLAVVRREEIVIVLPVREGGEAELVRRITETQATLARRDLPLTIGISTVRPDVGAVPDAYREAVDAREHVAPQGGVLGLPALRAIDYVAAVNRDGLRRLIGEGVLVAVEEDATRGGTLAETVEAYTSNSLNVAQTAERLGIHVNTAHYRLKRIAEQTGLDVRSVEDIMELVLAVRSVQAVRRGP
ncbi:MAG: hypothetical protein QOF76_4429 [Solirubrobacteraceae bacterium]|jgi:hypothetical protein|nr:hypothetical protein [Solirubrobacteraceae bacterium]